MMQVVRRSHWMETVDRVTAGDPRILGEDEDGIWYVPSRTRAEWWDRRFTPVNPTHWPYYLRSRITRRVAWLERAA
jgi:hypothetical protein